MTKALPKCPECSTTFKTIQLMAMHRAQAHGVAGTSRSTLQYRKAMAAKKAALLAAAQPPTAPDAGFLYCPHCDFRTHKPMGLNMHLSKKHKNHKDKSLVIVKPKTIPLTPGENHHENWEGASDGIQTTIALAIAHDRFKGLCTSVAAEFDLPPKRFASELARLIYSTQVR